MASRGRTHSIEDDDVTIHNVKAFLMCHDGKVRHSDLINFFRRPLTDPKTKGRCRANFKDILTKIAVFRNDNGERYVILPKSSGMRAECQHNVLAMKSFRNNQRRDQQGTGDDYQNADDVTDMAQDHVYSRNPVLGSSSTLSSQSSTSTFDSGIDGDQQSVIASIAGRIRDLSKSNNSLDEELMAEFNYEEGSEDAAFNGHNEFSEEEKQWMMYASLCDCQQLAAMMDKNPDLPGKRDFITGYTALHWGAKLGKRDLVRLIADAGVDVNLRTHGGQTALHLAAMHGHDMIIKMLINDYGSDVHARDYGGKKPKDLVKDTVAADIQRKLGRSLILDPNLHLVEGVITRIHGDSWTRFDGVDGHEAMDPTYTPETRRRLRTMSFLRKKKRWPPEKNDSDEDYERSSKDKHKSRPKSSIVVLTPETLRKFKERELIKNPASFEV